MNPVSLPVSIQSAYKLLDISSGDESEWAIRIDPENYDARLRLPPVRQQVRRGDSTEDTRKLFEEPPDGFLARLSRIDEESRSLTIQPVSREHYLLTNHVSQSDLTLSAIDRERSELDGYAEVSLNASPLANSIGIACVLRVQQSCWVWALRKHQLHVDGGCISCPVSGALMWRDASAGYDLRTCVVPGVIREAREELGLDVGAEEIKYLALARERRRRGKPQFFFMIDLPALSMDDLIGHWRSSLDGQREYERIGCAQDLSGLSAVSDELQTARFLASQVYGLG